MKKSQAKHKGNDEKHLVPCNFGKCDLVWLELGRENLKEEGNKLKPLGYGLFNSFDKLVTKLLPLIATILEYVFGNQC